MGTARSLSSGRALRGPVGAFARRLLLRPIVKRPVAVDDIDRECLQRCVPDNLEATVNDIGHVRQQRAGRKHDRILARLLYHGALNDIALLDPREGMTIQPLARLELVHFDNDLLVGRAWHIQPSDFVPPGRILRKDGRRHHDGTDPGHKGHGSLTCSHQTSPRFRNGRTGAALLARTLSSVYYGFHECSEPCPSSERSDWFGEPRRHV